MCTRCHVGCVGAYDCDIVAVVSDSACHRALFHAKAIDQTQAGGSLTTMTFDDSYHVILPTCFEYQFPMLNREFACLQCANKAMLCEYKHTHFSLAFLNPCINLKLLWGGRFWQAHTVFCPFGIMVYGEIKQELAIPRHQLSICN